MLRPASVARRSIATRSSPSELELAGGFVDVDPNGRAFAVDLLIRGAGLEDGADVVQRLPGAMVAIVDNVVAHLTGIACVQDGYAVL
jgi:hypothetical protein